MTINTSVYGTSEQWTPSIFQQAVIVNKNKWAFFRQNYPYLGTAVQEGKLSYSEGIDKSLSYCGLGRECALSNLAYITKNSGVVSISDYQERAVTNFGFFDQPRNITINQSPYFFTDNLGAFTWETAGDGDASSNYNRILAPYTLINPKNVVFLIRVTAYNSTFTQDVSKVTLKEYLTTYKTNYPNIVYVVIEPYIGDISLTDTRDTLGGSGYNQYYKAFQLAILDEYEIESKNIKFNAYDFWNMPVFGNFSSAYDLTHTNNDTPLGIVAYTQNSKDHIKITQQGEYPTGAKYYTEYYPEFEEDILKTVACFGLYFTTDAQTAINGALTASDMYIGILDSDGIGHGNYLRGSATATAPQNNWSDMTQSNYDYEKEVDKTKYNNNTQFYGTWSSSAFTKMYVLTESQVQQLATELYTAVSAAPTSEEIERYNQSVFLTQNPIDCIISLKRFPLDLPYSAAVPLKLGSYTTQVNAAPLLYSTGVYSFVFSRSVDNNLYQWFDKSFLDYEPYTKVELTIPFCGTVEIPTTYIYDYDTIDVKLIVDYITGACTAYIQVRNITIDSVSGDCAVTLPVNGLQSATLDSQIHSAATARDKSALTNGLGLIGGAASLIIGIATGGIGLAVAGGAAAIGAAANMIVNDKNIDYELKHMETPLKQIGSASGAIAQSYDMRCKMRITRPKISADYDAEVYANTIGFACLINTTVNNLSGLTVGDINLDGLDASDVEKQLIKNAFAGGVIL